MPELPEVETIRLQLQKYLIGRKINKIEVRVTKIFGQDKEKLVSGKIVNLRRFGKVLVADLDNGYSFLVHLKLTGQLVLSDSQIQNYPNKFTHVVFDLDNGAKLFFNDARKFGWIKVEKTAAVEKEGFIGKIGPEPFKGLTLKMFKEILAKSSRPVKIILMDQDKISGVGNIYANDALWLAGINPKTPAKNLEDNQVVKLLKALEKVLSLGMKYQGASDQWYITPEGKKGQYQNHFLVYGRGGEICKRCRKVRITKIFVGGRGTYFCSKCQPV